MAKAKLYELNEAAIAEQNFKAGQAALIVRSLTNRHPQSAQEIADSIKGELQTKQDPLRVVSFYLSTWKKAGWVRIVGVVGGAESPVSTRTYSAADEAPAIEQDDDAVEVDVNDLTEDDGFDYGKATAQEAVLNVMQSFGDSVAPKDVASELTVRGYSIDAKKARDVMRRLVEKGQLAKAGEGLYQLVQPAGVSS